jgi:hypothetical protein
VAHRYLPNGGPDKVDFMRSRAYIGQFSQDGSMFVAGFQVWGLDLVLGCLPASRIVRE